MSDTEDWDPLTISPSTLTIAAGAENTATVSVFIESGTICTLDRITVTVTSQTDSNVNDSTIAFAHRSKATFTFENLYKISIDLDIRLREDAENLVAKYYSWANAPQGQSVVHWENMPWHLTSVKYIINPTGFENVRLVLVDGTGAEIATVDTYTVRKSTLIGRVSAIKSMWPFATPDKKPHLISEISGIKSKWPFAPA